MIVTILITLSIVLGMYSMFLGCCKRRWISEDLKAIHDAQNERLERLNGSCTKLREDVNKLDKRMSQVETDLRQLTPIMDQDWGREDP